MRYPKTHKRMAQNGNCHLTATFVVGSVEKVALFEGKETLWFTIDNLANALN